MVLAIHDDSGAGPGSATQVSTPAPTGSTRYDGGPEEGSRAIVPAQPPSTATTAAPKRAAAARIRQRALNEAPGTRYDGGPEEGSRGSGR